MTEQRPSKEAESSSSVWPTSLTLTMNVNRRVTACSRSSSNAGAIVAYHDPHIHVIRPTREHSHWAGAKSVPSTRPTISGFDLVVIATAHACVKRQTSDMVPASKSATLLGLAAAAVTQSI
jgi:UDP-N-acetyl-D-mannosaminuronate dehydrogenase